MVKSLQLVWIIFIIYTVLEQPRGLDGLARSHAQKTQGGKRNHNPNNAKPKPAHARVLGHKSGGVGKAPSLKLRHHTHKSSTSEQPPIIVAIIPATKSADTSAALTCIRSACGLKDEVKAAYFCCCCEIHSYFFWEPINGVVTYASWNCSEYIMWTLAGCKP